MPIGINMTAVKKMKIEACEKWTCDLGCHHNPHALRSFGVTTASARTSVMPVKPTSWAAPGAPQRRSRDQVNSPFPIAETTVERLSQPGTVRFGHSPCCPRVRRRIH